MKVTPTCRYGHGDLKRNERVWSLPGIDLVKMASDEDAKQPVYSVTQNGHGFSVCIYRCFVCGYIELFDDVTDNE